MGGLVEGGGGDKEGRVIVLVGQFEGIGGRGFQV